MCGGVLENLRENVMGCSLGSFHTMCSHFVTSIPVGLCPAALTSPVVFEFRQSVLSLVFLLNNFFSCFQVLCLILIKCTYQG